MAMKMLSMLAPAPGGLKEVVSVEELAAEIESADPDKTIAWPRGPKGPFEAPAGVLLLAGDHSAASIIRGQNASRMRQLRATDYVIWYALGRP